MPKKKKVTKVEKSAEKKISKPAVKKPSKVAEKKAKKEVKKPEKVEKKVATKKPEKVIEEKPVEKAKKSKKTKKSAKKTEVVELPELSVNSTLANTLVLPIDEIEVVDGFNPRETLGNITDLSDSIKSFGMIENVVVWQDKIDGDKYKLICGHRRIEAAKQAGVLAVPVSVVLAVTNLNQALVLAVAENSADNRNNFTPIEEAKAYKRLMGEGYNVTEISMECNVSRKKIDKLLKILTLPDVFKDRFYDGKLTGTAASLFVDLPDGDKEVIMKVADNITTKAQIEEILRQARSPRYPNTEDSEDDDVSPSTKKDDKEPNARNTDGVYRNMRDTRNAALNLYAKYKHAKDGDDMLVAYEWALAALLYVMGEMSVIDPDAEEFQDGLVLLDEALSTMQGESDKGKKVKSKAVEVLVEDDDEEEEEEEEDWDETDVEEEEEEVDPVMDEAGEEEADDEEVEEVEDDEEEEEWEEEEEEEDEE